MAALQCSLDGRSVGAGFSMVVKVEQGILNTEMSKAAQRVHGISDKDIGEGFSFQVAWTHFLWWLESLSNAAVQSTDSSDSEEDEVDELPSTLPETPLIIIAAHNGVRSLGVRHCSDEHLLWLQGRMHRS